MTRLLLAAAVAASALLVAPAHARPCLDQWCLGDPGPLPCLTLDVPPHLVRCPS